MELMTPTSLAEIDSHHLVSCHAWCRALSRGQAMEGWQAEFVLPLAGH